MPVRTAPECHVSLQQVAAFRLARHSLLHRNKSDLVAICRSVCGIQAQLMASAEIACAVRGGKSVEDVRVALSQQRILVKTLAMRQTLHLLPAADFFVYMAALKNSRMAAVMRVMSKLHITQRQVDAMNVAVMDELSAGPLTKGELSERILHRAGGKGLKSWMELASNPFRPAIIQGLVCHGPDRGREATFIRVDQWLPSQEMQEKIDAEEAKRTLFRWFLRSYGPATLRDVSRWSGISIAEAKPVWESLAGELGPVFIEGRKAWILRSDLQRLQAAHLDAPVLRVLPHFDPYMLAHADKEHLVDARYYKRVYCNQGWLSPVVLLNGKVAGVWRYTRTGKALSLDVEFFKKLPKTMLAALEQEAGTLGQFMGRTISGIRHKIT